MEQNIGQLANQALKNISNNAAVQAKQSLAVQRKCEAVVKRYGDFESFIKTFNRDMQEKAGQHIDRVFTGNAPSLAIIDQSYGEDSAATFIMCHLQIVQDFCGIPNKLSPEKLFEIGKTIAAGFYYLKASEFCLFFLWLKCGKYGKFYGCIDPIVITNALQSFCKERVDYIDKAEKEQNLKRAIELRNRPHAVTFEEYLRMKNEQQR